MVLERLKARHVQRHEFLPPDPVARAKVRGLRPEQLGIHCVGNVHHVHMSPLPQLLDAGAAGDQGIGLGNASARIMVVGRRQPHDHRGFHPALLQPIDKMGQFAGLNDIKPVRPLRHPAGRTPFKPLEFQHPQAPSPLDLVPREFFQPRRMQNGRAFDRHGRRPPQWGSAQIGNPDSGPSQVTRNLQIKRLPPAPLQASHAVDEQHP